MVKFFKCKIGLVLLTVISVSILPACTKSGDAKDKTEVAHKHEDHKEAWTCPMHPQIIKDGPGKCPICGMDLVKADTLSNSSDQSEAHIPEGHAPFQLSNNRIQMIGVKYGTVIKKPLFKTIEAAGRVAFDPELYTAQNEYVEAIRQLDRVKDAPVDDVKHSAKRMVESAKLRLKILGLSDEQISKLRSTDPSQSSNLLITSPGENVWIYAEVFEMDLSSVEPDQEVKISGGSLEGRELIGKVASVDRVINPLTRTARVRVLVPNAKAFLRPEAFVNTTILSPLGEQTVIPFDAILDSGKEAWVFVVKDNGHFEPRTIIIKHYAGDEVAISQGLNPGERIVTSANFLIDSESRLKGVLSSQSGSTSGSDIPLQIDSPNEANDSPDSDTFADSQSDDKKKASDVHKTDTSTKNAATTKKESATTSKTPKCPKGQEWHVQMNHCMTKVGN